MATGGEPTIGATYVRCNRSASPPLLASPVPLWLGAVTTSPRLPSGCNRAAFAVPPGFDFAVLLGARKQSTLACPCECNRGGFAASRPSGVRLPNSRPSARDGRYTLSRSFRHALARDVVEFDDRIWAFPIPATGAHAKGWCVRGRSWGRPGRRSFAVRSLRRNEVRSHVGSPTSAGSTTQARLVNDVAGCREALPARRLAHRHRGSHLPGVSSFPQSRRLLSRLPRCASPTSGPTARHWDKLGAYLADHAGGAVRRPVPAAMAPPRPPRAAALPRESNAFRLTSADGRASRASFGVPTSGSPGRRGWLDPEGGECEVARLPGGRAPRAEWPPPRSVSRGRLQLAEEGDVTDDPSVSADESEKRRLGSPGGHRTGHRARARRRRARVRPHPRQKPTDRVPPITRFLNFRPQAYSDRSPRRRVARDGRRPTCGAVRTRPTVRRADQFPNWLSLKTWAG